MHCDVALFYHRRLSPPTQRFTHTVCMCAHTSSFHYPSPRSIPFDHSEIVVHLVARPSLLYIHPSCPTTGYTLCPRPFRSSSIDRLGHRFTAVFSDRRSSEEIATVDRLGKASPSGSFADIRRRSRGPLLFPKFPKFQDLSGTSCKPLFLKKSDACLLYPRNNATPDAKANQSRNDPIFRVRNYQNVFENIYLRRDRITRAYRNRRCTYTTLALNIVATIFH